MYKPALYENREKSGKFVHWERSLRQFIKVQGLDPLCNTVEEQHCRTVTEICCTGEALAYVHRLNSTCPPEAPVWRFEGLLSALRQHFTQP
jgi:hypothetical protein